MEKQSGRELQPEAEGFGPHFIRRYQVEIRKPVRTAEEVMQALQLDINRFSPMQNARFTKVVGEESELSVGDEFDIWICGPNDGSVVVTAVEPTSFCFHTIRGHPEAGQITFSAHEEHATLRFRIESHARSRDMLVHLMYHTAAVGKVKQEETWVHLCSAVAEFAGGEPGEVTITTYRCDDDQMTACTFEELADPVEQKRIDRVRRNDQSVRSDIEETSDEE